MRRSQKKRSVCDGNKRVGLRLTSVEKQKNQERIIFDNRTQMNADNQDFKYNELTEEIIRIFYLFIINWVMVFWMLNVRHLII